MISVRRLAREWALKILYQNDVNQSVLKETLDGTLDRLRKEFVKRGSKAGSGSLLEEEILEAFSAKAAETLPSLTPETESALNDLIKHFFQDAISWKSVVMNSEVKRNTFKSLMEIPKTITPDSPSHFFPKLPYATMNPAKLSAENAIKIRKIADWLQSELPYLVLNAYLKELNNVRPQDTLLIEANSFINEGWSHFGNELSERWMKAGQTVQKQTADWLKVAGFAYSLATGASREQEAIDKALAELAEGWSLERQAAVDRNILRLAAYEMLYEEKTPASVAINEAVELAKKYSAADSGRFVNGILGALALKLSGKAVVAEEDAAENIELEFDSEEAGTLVADE